MAQMLALHAASAAERAADPGAAAMWAYALAHGAPRPGEEVFAFRTYMDAEAYQAPSASFNVATIMSVQHYVGCPRLAWDFIGGWADPDAIAPFMAHIDYARVPEADFEVGGRRYGVFAHDWRRTAPKAWLELMAARELADEPAGGAPPPLPAPGLALSQPEFAGAVRAALRDLRRPEALAASPLRSRAWCATGGAGEPVAEVLEALLREAVAALQADPRDEKLAARSIAPTCGRPPTQEAAAELLGAAVQLVPPPPGARDRARRRVAVGARALRLRALSREPTERHLAWRVSARRAGSLPGMDDRCSGSASTRW